MDEIKRKIIERRRQSILRIPERRRTYPGSTPRPFDPREFASPLDYDRFLFNLGANEMSPFDSTDALSDTAVHLRPSSLHPSDSEDDSHQRTNVPRGALSVDRDDVWLTPCASLPRDQHTGETEQEEGQQVGQQEGEAATSPAATPSPETALIRAFDALQMPSRGSQLPESSGNENDSDRQTSVPSDAQPTDAGDVLSQPSPSLPQNLHSGNEGREQERKQEDEEEEAATQPATVPQPQMTLSGAFRALQLPSEISQADFIHLAVQFVFENSPDVFRFRYANNFKYDEAALARSFSAFSMAIWGDDAPEGDGATQWLARLTQFFAILRTGNYIRGGTNATPRELLIRLVGAERVESVWNDHAVSRVEAELIDAHRNLDLTEVDEGRVEDFADLAAAYAFETYTRLNNKSADLQGLRDLYDPQELATSFYFFVRVALWDRTVDESDVYDTRIARLERFFHALRDRNYARHSAGTPSESLVRLVGLQMVTSPDEVVSDASANERRDSDGDNTGVPIDETGSNIFLSEIFTLLDVRVLPRDRSLRDAFQHAVTHIAFETINATRTRPLTSFGPDVFQGGAPNVFTHIINRVVSRYAGRLWPHVEGMSQYPNRLLTPLRVYVSALIGFPAERAQNDETALRVFDTLMGLTQEESQAGLAPMDNDDDEEDDGLECELKEVGVFDSCLIPFATGPVLHRHMIERHDYSEENARDIVREAEVALKRRAARRH